MCKRSSGISLIHFSVCEFDRLNPRFVSFSRAFAMVKETFKRIQKNEKVWSKNKPTCENAVSQTLYGSCTLRVMGSWVYIWNNLYLNCGCRWKWRMIMARIHLQPQFKYELFHIYTSHHFTSHRRDELKKLTPLIFHFHLQPQFKYELLHIYFTSKKNVELQAERKFARLNGAQAPLKLLVSAANFRLQFRVLCEHHSWRYS